MFYKVSLKELKVNPDAFFEYIGTQEVKEKLISNTQELMDRGGFGSPTFFIDETDMYFGNDRIQLIEENYEDKNYYCIISLAIGLFAGAKLMEHLGREYIVNNFPYRLEP